MKISGASAHVHEAMSEMGPSNVRLAFCALIAVVGCGRVADQGPGTGDRDAASVDAGPIGDVAIEMGTTDAGLLEGGPDSAGAPDAVVDPNSCPSPQPPAAPLRRLTRFEYDNTVRDLLGEVGHAAESLPPDGLTNDADQMSVSSELVAGYHRLAHDLALKISRDPVAVGRLIGCDVALMGEDACRDQFIRDFVGRAFRRPVEAADQADLGQVFTTGQKLGGDFASGVRAVVEVVLEAPEFLYRVEFGEPAGPALPSLARPTPYEMATRLSYFLWGSTPDAALLDAAAQGKLRTKEDVVAQAKRLLADPRAHDVVHYFFRQLFLANDIDFKERELDLNPAFSIQLSELFQQETEHFVDDVVWQGSGKFEDLLTAPYTWVNGPLASFYGMSGVTGDEYRKVNLDPTKRIGLLTQASFLLSNSSGTSTHPSLRGKAILERFFCQSIPHHPADIDPPVLPPLPVGLTTRDHLLQLENTAFCRACHNQIDPMGFVFEHYDALGAWRDSENNRAIDATGDVHGTDVDGSYDGAIAFVQKIATSEQAGKCHVGRWMAFAYGRAVDGNDKCSRDALEQSFSQTNGNVRELLLALTQTDGFLYRPTQP